MDADSGRPTDRESRSDRAVYLSEMLNLGTIRFSARTLADDMYVDVPEREDIGNDEPALPRPEPSAGRSLE